MSIVNRRALLVGVATALAMATPARAAMWFDPTGTGKLRLPSLRQGLAAVGATPYLGLVATRGRMMQAFNASNTQMMARTGMVATDDLTSVKVLLGNFINTGDSGGAQKADIGPGAAAAVTCAIEYPSGTLTQVKFGGAASGSIADKSFVESDFASVTIPKGSTFWVREFRQCSGGTPFIAGRSTAYGDGLEVGTSLTDKTMSGTVGTSINYRSPPLGVVAMTTTVSVVIVGDSIGAGYNDSDAANATPYDNKKGVIARSLGGLAFLNLSVSGEQAKTFPTNGTVRSQLIKYGGVMICQMGTNDIHVAGSSAAQTATDVAAIHALMPTGRKVWQATVTHKSNSTDNYATTANQTADTSGRNAFNAIVRAGTVSNRQVGYLEVADVFEPSRDAGIWALNGGVSETTDGVHPKDVATYSLVAAAATWGPSTFTL